MTNIKAGTIFIAEAGLSDPAFAKSVMLVLKHDETGTTAVNLAGGQVGPLQIGGPETADVVHFLHKAGQSDRPLGETGYAVLELKVSDESDKNVIPLLNKIVTTMSDIDLADQLGPAALLMGRGNWGQGQLEGEMKGGAWKLTRASLDELMKLPSDERWQTANETAAPAIAAKARRFTL